MGLILGLRPANMSLQNNALSHWLDAYLELALKYIQPTLRPVVKWLQDENSYCQQETSGRELHTFEHYFDVLEYGATFTNFSHSMDK